LRQHPVKICDVTIESHSITPTRRERTEFWSRAASYDAQYGTWHLMHQL
jgi:hypothetical protein